MVTSHNVVTDAIGRPAAPSAGLAPAAGITRAAEAWLTRVRLTQTTDDHFRTEVQGKDPAVQDVLECLSCGRGIFLLSPNTDGPGYACNVAQIKAAVVSHLHAHHPDALL